MGKREVTDEEMTELAEVAALTGAATALRLFTMLYKLRHSSGIRAIIGSEDLQETLSELIGKSTASMATAEIGDEHAEAEASARLAKMIDDVMTLLPPALIGAGAAPQIARA